MDARKLVLSFSLVASTVLGSACGRSADEVAGSTLPAVQVAGETTIPPTTVPTQVTYIVQAGESLSVIASRFGVDIRALADFNAIADVDSLKVGQLLSIPPTTAPTTTVPTTDTEPAAATTG